MYQLKTGRQLVIQQEFNRRLLSEYNPHFTLDKYVAYLELKQIISDISAEQTRLDAMCERAQNALGLEKAGASSPNLSNALASIAAGAGHPAFAASPPPRADGSNSLPAIPPAASASNSASLLASTSQQPPLLAPTQIYTYLYAHTKTPQMGPASESHHDDEGEGEMPPHDLNETTRTCAVTPSAHIPNALPGRLLLPTPDEMERSRVRLSELHAKFFDELKKSHRRVKSFLIEKENAAIHQIADLRRLSEAALAKLPPTTIPAIFRRVRNIALFRDLNTVGFQHIMQKYYQTCCQRSLEQQEKLRIADSIIANSHLCKPKFDADQQLDLITSVYATIRGESYEAARHQLDLAIERDLSTHRRIMPVTESHFYTSGFVHHQDQGSFALKLLCGLGAKPLTKKISALAHSPILNCDNRVLPGGELAPKLHEAVRGDDVFIIQSMHAALGRSMSTSIMQLALSIQNLTLASAARVTAVIPYMAYNSNPNASAAIAEMLMLNGCKQVLTLDLRSDQVEGMFGNLPIYSVTALMEFISYLTDRIVKEEQSVRNLVVVSPDGDGVARARQFADAFSKKLNKELFGAESNALSRPTAQVVLPAGEEDDSSFIVDHNNASTSQCLPPSSSLDPDGTPPRTLTRLQSTLLSSRVAANNNAVASPQSLTAGSLPSSPSPVGLAVTTPSTLLMATTGSGGGAGTVSASGIAMSAEATQQLMSPNSTTGAVNLERVFIPVATALKRPSHECDDIDVIGEVKGQHCFIIDTVIDEAVNATTVAKKLKLGGAARVTVVATHALFSSSRAFDLIAEPWIDELIVTDSVPQDEALRRPDVAKKLRILSIAPLLAEAIQRLHSDNCLSTLFDR